MSLSDDIDRENGDLDWREYDAEGTNAGCLLPHCSCGCGAHMGCFIYPEEDE